MTKRKKSDLIDEKPADAEAPTPTEERYEKVDFTGAELVMVRARVPIEAKVAIEEKEGPRVAGGEKTPAPPAPEIPWWQIEEDLENIFGD